MINIAELLKDAPTGMKLYSPLFGEVEFAEVMDTDYVPIRVIKRGYGLRFDECGRYMGNEYPDSECLLFPSKDCRTWEGWKLHVEPKFEVGDWVVRKDGETFYGGNYAEQITLIEVDEKGKCIWLSSTSWVNDDDIRLWTIQDAKDGDVLVTEDYIFIFKYILHGGVHLYCHYNIDDEEFDSDIPDAIIGNIHDKGAHFRPATKEQRDLLFQKMKEAGYQWDEKKKLRKIIKPNFKVGDKIEATIYGINRRVTIRGVDKTNRCYLGTHAECIGFSEQDQWHLALKPHYDIANFKVGMPVLVRIDNSCKWSYTLFSHYNEGWNYPFSVASCCSVKQCIPFNKDTEHLLGTTDPCGEEYINW